MTEALDIEQSSNTSIQIAPRTRRIFAFIIDMYVYIFSLAIVSFASVDSDFLDTPSENLLLKSFAAGVIGLLLFIAKDIRGGSSFGRWVTGIEVRDINNPTQVPSAGKLFLRNLTYIIYPIEAIVLVASKEKRRLGDKMANTIVVRREKPVAKAPRVIALIGIFVAFFVSVFMIASSSMKNSEAYHVAIMEIEHDEYVAEQTGGITGYGMFPTGSIQTSNGYGSAYLEITVKGNDQDVDVYVSLSKDSDSDWQIISIDYGVE